MFQLNWQEFLEDLKPVPSRVDADQIAKPATDEEVVRLEVAIRSRLPPVFRNFLTTVSAGLELRWFLDEGVLVQLPGEREPIYAGEFSFHLDKLLSENPQFSEEYESSAYLEEYRPANLLALMSTPNGDQFSVILQGPEADSIKYLSHDLEEIHLYKVGNDIDSFLTEYARIGFAGPEFWIWEQFTNQRTTAIDSKCRNARLFLDALHSVQRTSEAEELHKRAEKAARVAHFQISILPAAQRLLERKDANGFVALLSEYSDLLSGGLKARYEYFLKKHND